MRKDKLCVPFRVGHAKQSNQDNDHATGSPVDTDFVDQIELFGAKDIDQHAH